MEQSGRAVVERYVAALTKLDWETAADLLSPDYVEDYPQSGERVVGPDAYRNLFRNMEGAGGPPNRYDQRTVDIVGGEDRWVMTPTFLPLRVEGSGDTYTTLVDATYPDGSRWFIFSLVRVGDGKIVRARTFWAGEFEPAEWRAEHVQLVPDRTERVRP